MNSVKNPFQILKRVIEISSNQKNLKTWMKDILGLFWDSLSPKMCAGFILNKSGKPFSSYVLPLDFHVTGKELYSKISQIISFNHNELIKEPFILISNHNLNGRDDLLSDFSTLLILSLADETRIYGFLIFGFEKYDISEDDKDFFRLVTYEMSSLIHKTSLWRKTEYRLYRVEEIAKEREDMLNEISLLYETSKAMIGTVNLDDLLYIILTAITVGEGLGFNRAILLLVNNQSNLLQGMMGVGQDTPEDAAKIWKELGKEKRKLIEWIEYLKVQREEYNRSNFEVMAKSIRITLKEDGGILARTVLKQKEFNILDSREDPFIHKKIFNDGNGSAFAAIPLLSKGKVIGVIYVDNFFTQRPIDESSLKVLNIFASQAGMAIDNSFLIANLVESNSLLKETQQKLIEHEKLAVLGTMAASVAHEVKNPLVSIGGFARRLLKNIDTDKEKRYSEIIIREVDRLEKILNNVLLYSRQPSLNFKEENLNKIIEESLMMFYEDFKLREIEILKEFSHKPLKLYCDSYQLKQVFINIFTNARQAIGSRGKLQINTYYKNDSKLPLVVKISDSGGGVDPSVIDNIFNPFFTTKSKGFGLGLAIAYRIVGYHGGTIKIENQLGKGVTFIIEFTDNFMYSDKKSDELT
jgi:signal transduction histidine kinase